VGAGVGAGGVFGGGHGRLLWGCWR
jgi:hypothetical protein